jgi:hypothetical protein
MIQTMGFLNRAIRQEAQWPRFPVSLGQKISLQFDTRFVTLTANPQPPAWEENLSGTTAWNINMRVTNFDRYLAEQLRDPKFAKAFRNAGRIGD